MKNQSSIPFFRVLTIFTVIFIITEMMYKTGNEPAFISNASVALFLIGVLLTLIIMEGFFKADKNLHLNKYENESANENISNETQGGFKGILKKLWNSKPIEQESDILLDHDYDGIKELDNALPPWWLYGFYASIVFAFIYFGYYQFMGGDNQFVTYDKEVETARIEVERYKRENPSTIDLDNMAISSDTELGKKIFKQNCAVCHLVDGGGSIGPNLTDEYWILGGGIKNVYNTIAEGGRDGKGMIAWKNSLNPEKIQQVASYILTFQGTTPKKPKEKEGDLWKGEE